jgi:hypothetical protein
MRTPVRPHAEYVYIDEDDGLKLEFTVEFTIADNRIEDVEFRLESVTETENCDHGPQPRSVYRRSIVGRLIERYEREMEARYADIPSVAEEVQAAILAAAGRE